MATPYVSEQVDQKLTELYERHRSAEGVEFARFYGSGRGYYAAADAGPERETFGVSFATNAGSVHSVGDCTTPFALQSVSKVFVYALALEDHGREEVQRHVGVEPSGDAYNSIVFDERRHRPFNPMVNAGALVTSDLVLGKDTEEKVDRILSRLRVYAGNDALVVDSDIFEHEMRTADRNRATAYLMRSEGMLSGDVEATLAVYLQQCSVKVTCRDLAVMAATLSNGGVNPVTGERALPREYARDVLSVMYTCGMYDAVGQWTYEVGVPAKSGVSGSILAALPGKAGLGVFSPGLDEYGNSVRGVLVCHEVSERLGLHVFASEDEDVLLDAVPSPP